MKCPHCGNSIFEGQFRCEKCNSIIVLALKEKEESKKKDKKEKE